jgi:hypothetical protein
MQMCGPSRFHTVLYIRKSLHLVNAQGSLQSGMSGSSSETQVRFVMVWAAMSWYSILLVPIITLHS